MTIRLDPEDHELTTLTALAGDWLGGHVLEIGCGRGRLTWRYARQADRVTAIDPDPARIAAARADCPADLTGRVKFRAVSLETFQPPAKYDLVLLAWSL